MEDPSDDLLIEILIRQSIRKVHQCKAVSKRWLRLIANPQFRHRYCRVHDSKNKFLLLVNVIKKDGKITSFDDQVLPIYGDHHDTYRISLGSQNNPLRSLVFVSRDLLLFDVSETGTKIFTASGDLILTPKVFKRRLVIYNVLTQQSFRIPPLCTRTEYYSTAIEFIGCLCFQDQYKVVCVHLPPPCLRRSSQNNIHIFVYSSKDDSWNRYEVTAPSRFLLIPRNWSELMTQYATICNGKLHWCNNGFIMVYDPFNTPYHCGYIKFPEASSFLDIEKVCITNVQGYIRLYDQQKIPSPHLTFWDLEDYTNRTWTEHGVYIGDIDDISGDSRIQNFTSFDKDVVYILSSNRLLAFNLRNKLVQILADFNPSNVIASNLFTCSPPSWPTKLGNK